MMMKKRMLRYLLTATAAVASAFVLSTGALAATSAAGTVSVGTRLNIRQSDTTSSAVVGSLQNNASVTVLGSSNGFYKIAVGSGTGWVSGHYVTLEGTVNVANTLNVRSSASSAATATGRLYDNTLVTVTDAAANGWYKISYYGGTGWVNGAYLTLGNNYIASGAKAQTVTDVAQRMIGVPYVFGGTTTSGFDCSGLALYVYNRIGVTLPHSSSQQAALGTAVARSDLRPGDLVFFDTDGGHNNITHEGIYIGGNLFVNAESGSVMRVNECSLTNSYWSSAYMTARRIIQ